MYKNKTTGSSTTAGERRIIRRLEEAKGRKSRRSSLYGDNRGLLQKDQPDAQSSREVKLLKWKAEKELQRQLEKEKKKSVFRAGLPHRKYTSPVFLHQCLSIVKSTEPSAPIPRITKATAKRIAARERNNDNSAPVPGVSNDVKKSEKISKRSAKGKDTRMSFAPEDHEFKAPEGLPTLILFGREALEGKTEEPVKMPVYFSPFIITPSKIDEAKCEEELRSIETSSGALNEVTDQRIELLKKPSCQTVKEDSWSVQSRLEEENLRMPKGEACTSIIRKLDFDLDTNLSDFDESDQHAKLSKTKDEDQGASSSGIKNSVSIKRASQRTCKGVLVERLTLTVNSMTPRSNQMTQILTGSSTKTGTPSNELVCNDLISFDTPFKDRADSKACAEKRSVHPMMTPRSNQKTEIFTGLNTKTETPLRQLEGDLICFDSPKDLPPWVRRSPRL